MSRHSHGILNQKVGPYPKGLEVCTDPSERHDPPRELGKTRRTQVCFVDPGRFATWKKKGWLEPPAAPPAPAAAAAEAPDPEAADTGEAASDAAAEEE